MSEKVYDPITFSKMIGEGGVNRKLVDVVSTVFYCLISTVDPSYLL